MKKTSILSVFIILCCAISFTSCEIEPLDAELNLNDFNANENPNSGGNNSGGGVSSGDYWPTVLNNEWIFSQNGVNQDPMRIISTSTLNGSTYYDFDTVFGQSNAGSTAAVALRLKKNNGDYFLKTDDFSTTAGPLTFTTSGYEFIILKDYLEVNGTWSGTFSQTSTYSDPTIPSVTYNTTYEGTILEKGISVTVAGETFNNVIKFKVVQNTNIMGQITVSETTYWFAKDVGPIKSSIEAQGQTYLNELIDYTLF